MFSAAGLENLQTVPSCMYGRIFWNFLSSAQNALLTHG